MKELILVGGGDWGLEVFSWLEHARGYNEEWKFKGVLDLDEEKVANELKQFYLGSENVFEITPNDYFVCCIAEVMKKESIVNSLKSKGANFINIIHNTNFTSGRAKLGEGLIIGPFTYISNDTKIGDHVSVNAHSSIGHHVEVGDFCQINSNCDITGHVKIGTGCFVGSSVCIIPRVTIARYNKIGAGSVVLKSSNTENTTLFGNPAKKII